MTPTNRSVIALRLTADSILDTFFTLTLDGKVGLTRQRIERVQRSLGECIEAEAERILESHSLRALAAEREREPQGAAARVVHADDLLYLLTCYLEERWAAIGAQDRRVQLRIVDELVGHILARRLVDKDAYICVLLDLRGDIDRAQRAVQA